MNISTQILQKIQKKKVLFFCGAGISLEPPAGLPDWKKLRDFTLESVAKKNDTLTNILPSLLATPIMDAQGERGISPEVVASEILANCSGYFESFRVLRDGKPNVNHMYLAKMARAGFIRYIITTNFDTFIEDALQQEQVPFYVCRTNEEFAKFDEQQQVVVFKLHGCLSQPQTITSTVEQEARGLSFEKKQAIRTLIGHYHFLFWGYSGSDLTMNLDYLEHISCKDRALGFYWHFVEQGNFKEEINPNVQKLIEIYRSRGQVVHGLFPRVFSELFSEQEVVNIDCSYEEQQEWQQQKNTKMQKELDTWAEEHLNQSQACTILGNLLYHNGKLQAAMNCYLQGLEVAKQNQDQSSLAVSLSNCGGIYRVWGQYQEALSYYQQAEQIARDYKDYEKLCIYLNNIGKVYRVQGNYEKAASYYKDSAKLSKEIKNERSEGVALNNLGMAHFYMQDYEKAQLCYERSLHISQKIGDKQAMCAQLSNIGNVYGRKNDSQQSLKYYSQALDIALALGDQNSLIVCWNNLGVTSRLLEQYSQAKEYFLKSLQASQYIGDLVNAATTSKNLAILCEMEESYTQAIDFYEMSIGYFRNLQDNEQINNIQNRISKLHLLEDEMDLQMPSSIMQVEDPLLSHDEIMSQLQISEDELQRLIRNGKIQQNSTKHDINSLREELMMEQTVVIPIVNIQNTNASQQKDKAMSQLQIEEDELQALIQSGQISPVPTQQEIDHLQQQRMMQKTLVMNAPLPTPQIPQTEKTREKAMSELQIDHKELDSLIRSGKLSLSPTLEEIENVKDERMMQRTIIMDIPNIKKERETLKSLMGIEAIQNDFFPASPEVQEETNIDPIFVVNTINSQETAEKLREMAMSELQMTEEELEQMIVSGEISAAPSAQEIQNIKNNRMMQKTMQMASFHKQDASSEIRLPSPEKPTMATQMQSMSLEFLEKLERPMMEIQRGPQEIPRPLDDDEIDI